ncbi:MAG: hypothetical protein PHV59_07110 [Victivallales bacterium]|nr:hypothetical protein [Victivallales bacterium]
MKTKRRNKILSGIFIVLIALGLIIGAVILYLDGILASAMRKLGTEATGTDLRVKSVSLSLRSGHLAINEMTIANPTGYESSTAFWMKRFDIKLDINSLFSDTIIIDEVMINDIWIDFEPTLEGSNLTDIKNNIMKFTAGQKTASKETEQTGQSAAPAEKSKQIIIKSFVISKGEITVASKAFVSNISVKLNRIELNDLGKDNVMGEVFSQILDAIMNQVALDVGAAKIEGLSPDVLKTKLFKDLPGATENIGKGVGKTLKDITNKLF